MKFTRKGYYLIGIFIICITLGLITLILDNKKNENSTYKKPGIQKNNYDIDIGQRITVLLLGVDARGEEKSRTDTIILASINPVNDQVSLLSIPRDTRVKINGSWSKINAAYVYDGIQGIEEQVTKLTGIPIDYFAVINFKAFTKVVDLYNGVDVVVPERFYHPSEGIDLQPGPQHLDGKAALAYSRFRYTKDNKGDLGRAERQQEVISLIFKKISNSKNIFKIKDMVQIGLENVETDFKVNSLKKLMEATKIIRKVSKKEVSSYIIPGKSCKIDGIWYFLADKKESKKLFKKVYS